MKKISKILLLSLVTATTLVGCGSGTKTTDKKQSETKKDLVKGDVLLDEQKKGAIVIDVRKPEQYNEGHIKDSLNIPLAAIEKEIEAKAPKKDTKIFLYCNTGKQSGQAFEKLKKMGYTDVSNAQGVKQYKYDLVK